MRLFRQTLASFCLVLILAIPASGQVTDAQIKLLGGRPKLDYSYCRFDSTTIALIEQNIPRGILNMLASEGMNPRFVPLYITAMDVDFDEPTGPPAYKILYANDGEVFATLVVLKRGDDGIYAQKWTYNSVPPAPRVKLRAKDLTGDGRLDVIASARGGDPVYEAMTALEFDNEGRGRLLIADSRSAFDPRATFGIGLAAIDSLGRDGRPAIEVWHDDSTNAGANFIRVRLQYSDTARIFLPEMIDTLKELPFWCSKRRPTATKQ
jgi:hypothetical protein